MYRVELKGRGLGRDKKNIRGVPNVPCGVESSKSAKAFIRLSLVPNVPCGVESLMGTIDINSQLGS